MLWDLEISNEARSYARESSAKGFRHQLRSIIKVRL